jgi:predicted phosphohydrolase
VHAEKLVERLRASFEAVRNGGYTLFTMFLHYPPTNILERRSGFTNTTEEYGADQVIYAHGQSRSHLSTI